MAQTEKVCFDRILPSNLHRPPAGRPMQVTRQNAIETYLFGLGHFSVSL